MFNFLMFNSSIFWNAFSAIGTTLCAIVAIVISIISYKKSNLRKLKVKTDWKVDLDFKNKDKDFETMEELEKNLLFNANLFVDILNVGVTQVNIYDIGVCVKNNKNQMNFSFKILENKIIELPYKIEPGVSFNYEISQKDLDELVKDEKVHKNDKAYIYCKTSIGTFYSKEVKDFKLSCPKNLVIDIV